MMLPQIFGKPVWVLATKAAHRKRSRQHLRGTLRWPHVRKPLGCPSRCQSSGRAAPGCTPCRARVRHSTLISWTKVRWLVAIKQRGTEAGSLAAPATAPAKHCHLLGLNAGKSMLLQEAQRCCPTEAPLSPPTPFPHLSASLYLHPCPTNSELFTMLRWLSAAALGKPVVPARWADSREVA